MLESYPKKCQSAVKNGLPRGSTAFAVTPKGLLMPVWKNTGVKKMSKRAKNGQFNKEAMPARFESF